MSETAQTDKTYICPVCGWDGGYQRGSVICPCCGAPGGVQLAPWMHGKLRQAWIDRGMDYWLLPPQSRNPALLTEQLRRVCGWCVATEDA